MDFTTHHTVPNPPESTQQAEIREDMEGLHEPTVLPEGGADATLSSVPERLRPEDSRDAPAWESTRLATWTVPHIRREGHFSYFGPMSIDGFKRDVESFLSEYLPSRPENRRGDLVEMFAEGFPELTIEQQAALGEFFIECLDLYQLPSELSDRFWEGLPQAIELMSPDGDESMDGSDDSWIPGVGAVPWFNPTTIIGRDPARSEDPFYGPDTEGSAAPDEIRDWTTDLSCLHTAFFDIHDQMSDMIPDLVVGVSADPLHIRAERLLRESQHDLFAAGSFIELAAKPRKGPFFQSLVSAERSLATAREKIFRAETYLVTQEDTLLAGEDWKFLGHASRYERSRYRDHLRRLVASCRTERVRIFSIGSSSTELEPVTRSYDESEDKCPICYDDLPEEGEIAPPPAVTFTCCNKAFHVDCLLEWLFGKIRQGMHCPMCRKGLDLDFLGALMEQKVQELQCL
ncbi:hypothetical protein A1O7_09274 [Cladophialophora yegresii CBS 114405]|uniref:RING-type domain-containing protein n=1 Tax=Cladophialophora yegresii CBS 114405 TaxID=1182544 RepID=W9VEA1_9EURO|nr:uncharacterized protein A1O7_09274 [Cladophialophora yegresii CBS 114405]EXJ53937.1 hypothetical protein A1O7_09274 [Cladophialophora yegresii CBS 114405]